MYGWKTWMVWVHVGKVFQSRKTVNNVTCSWWSYFGTAQKQMTNLLPLHTTEHSWEIDVGRRRLCLVRVITNFLFEFTIQFKLYKTKHTINDSNNIKRTVINLCCESSSESKFIIYAERSVHIAWSFTAAL